MTNSSPASNFSKAFLMMLDSIAKDFSSRITDLIRVDHVVSGIITRFSTCNCCNYKTHAKTSRNLNGE